MSSEFENFFDEAEEQVVSDNHEMIKLQAFHYYERGVKGGEFNGSPEQEEIIARELSSRFSNKCRQRVWANAVTKRKQMEKVTKKPLETMTFYCSLWVAVGLELKISIK